MDPRPRSGLSASLSSPDSQSGWSPCQWQRASPIRNRTGTSSTGRSKGGTHVGGGRSVAPRRDEAVDPDQTVAGDTVTPKLGATKPERARRGSGNPLDL